MLYCKIINTLDIEVRTEFPNVWGENTNTIPMYIQSTTYPVILKEPPYVATQHYAPTTMGEATLV